MIKTRGFTLIEAVLVIVITGILAGVVAVFIAKPVGSYVDTVRRAALSDIADGALRRIGREVRSAVPNSLRVTTVAAGNFVEFIPTNDGARYRVEQTAGTGNILDFTLSSTETGFDIFGVSPILAVNKDFLVIFNTGQCSNAGCTAASPCIGANAYEGCNRRVISGTSTTLSGGVTYGSGITFVSATTPMPFDSPGHRLAVVPSTGPVTYGCVAPTAAETAAGIVGPSVIRRYTNYNIASGVWSTALSGPPPVAATTAILADSVSACTFTYAPGVTARSGLLTLAMTVTRSGESVTLYHEIHVDNQP